MAAMLMVLGGALAWWSGTGGAEPVAAPMPSQTFAVSSPTPDQTRSATVAPIPDDSPSSTRSSASQDLEMSPERMGPSRLYLPTLGIYASLTDVRFSGSSLTIPREPWRVGLDIDSAPLTATEGTSLLAGHVDLSGTPGALAALAQAEPGAMVYITDDEGRRADFVTTGLQRYSKVALPRSLFALDGPRQVALVTCGGPVMEIEGERHYRDNVVLTAIPA